MGGVSFSLVPRPFIQRVYGTILKAIRAGVARLGLGRRLYFIQPLNSQLAELSLFDYSVN